MWRFILPCLFLSRFVGAATAPYVEFSLAYGTADCAKVPEVRDFLTQVSAWKSFVSTLTIYTGKNIAPECTASLEQILKTRGFKVRLGHQPSGMKVVGLFGLEPGGKTKSERAREPGRLIGTSPTETAEDEVKQEEAVAAAEKKAEEQKVKAAADLKARKEKEERDSKVLGWRIGILPQFVTASGSGIADGTSGKSIGRFAGKFKLDERSDLFADLITPFNLSSQLPLALILSAEWQYIAWGGRRPPPVRRFVFADNPAPKPEVASPKYMIQPSVGFIYLNQNPGTTQSLTKYHQSSLLSTLAAPQVGIRATRWLSKEWDVNAQFFVIPVFPSAGNGFSFTNKAAVGAGYCTHPYCFTLNYELQTYNVSYTDPKVGSLNTTYTFLTLGIWRDF